MIGDNNLGKINLKKINSGGGRQIQSITWFIFLHVILYKLSQKENTYVCVCVCDKDNVNDSIN